ncbi:alpha/beta fold hydrolase [Xanthobacter sediminis]
MSLRLRAAVIAAVRRLGLAAGIGLALAAPARAQSDFYRATPMEIAGPPGTLIRQEPMFGAPDGAAAYRVLYRSRSVNDEPIAVSGVVIVPQGAPPPGGRPIVAWAHPTTGVVPRCAPSLALFLFQQIQGSRPMVERGYAIAATDYPGLGTPEPHPYLVGTSEGRAVLDSVRVARGMPGVGGGSRFTVWGHSQGGQAALYAGLIAHSYAPELSLLGIAAAAPATDLVTLMEDDFNSSGGKNLTAMTLWSWARVFNAPIDRVVQPEAMPTVDRLAAQCIESAFDLWVHQRLEHPLERAFLSVPNIAAVEPWRSIARRNSPGPVPASIPLFIAQGTADQLVRPSVTLSYAKRQCAGGSPVRLHIMPDVGHGFAAHDSTDQALAWMSDRFAGTPAPSDCGRIGSD